MRSNILHIFSDQYRFDCIGALGNDIIKTPNLDRLAKMGVAFTNAYTPSPVCVAARCSMIFGQYPTKTDCWANDTMPQGKTFMETLTEQGYATHGIGKCHFTPETNALRGFASRERQEECSVLSEDVEPYYRSLKDNGYTHCYEPHGSRGEMYYIPQVSKLPENHHPTNWVGERSVEFIKSNTGRPWYLFSSFIHPHPPFSPPVPWNEMYNCVDMPEPNIPHDSEELLTFINKIQNRYKYRDRGVDKNLILTMKAYYYACVSFLDHQIGKMLDVLEKTNQLDNTLIVFASDHGEHLGDLGCFGKRSMHDTCAKIPLVMYQKGVFEGGVSCDAPVSLVDLAPTFTGESAGYDGEDIRKIYSDEIQREYVYSLYSAYQDCQYAGVKPPKEDAREVMSNLMIKNKQWKYIYSVADEREFLFKNGDENINLAGIAKYNNVQSKLRSDLIRMLEEEGENGFSDGGQWKRFGYCFELPSNPRAGLLTQNVSIDWFS